MSAVQGLVWEKIRDNIGQHLHFVLGVRVDQLEKVCGSPIEVMLAGALLIYDKLNHMPDYPLHLSEQRLEATWGQEARLLIPQYKFETYRIDFVIRDGPHSTFIECDGHDFHERTKEQAARDRARDRAIQTAGHPILRFTGSEIHKDPWGCADQIMSFVDERNVPAELRSA